VHFNGERRESPAYPGDYDITIIADFGHGDIPNAYPGGKFLAVNAQTNSSNIGYNLITKYKRADYIVIDEPEARLAAADRYGPIEEVIGKLAWDRCDKFVVTHGAFGAIGYDKGKFYRCPAFTDQVVDTMGAGDAFFAVTAPMARYGKMEDLLRIGNAAGAIKTQIVGHRSSVTKEALIEFLRTH
jgi:sugar/nucleoside kinase (ribokinase family)